MGYFKKKRTTQVVFFNKTHDVLLYMMISERILSITTHAPEKHVLYLQT